VLYASSSAPDTDFTAKLVDVAPCGGAINLTDGIIRARFSRIAITREDVDAGRGYAVHDRSLVNGELFKAGHRIRLEVSSSNFPRFDRNPNTGHELFADAGDAASSTDGTSRPYLRVASGAAGRSAEEIVPRQ